MATPVLEKQCSKCKTWKPADLRHFYARGVGSDDGLFGRCKACVGEEPSRANERHQQHKNKYAARIRAEARLYRFAWGVVEALLMEPSPSRAIRLARLARQKRQEAGL